jgi:hypothetical protein
MIMAENPKVRPLPRYLRSRYLFASAAKNRLATRILEKQNLRRIAKKNGFTRDAFQVVVVPMKAWSWYLIIAAVFAALTLSSCALSQEGVAPNRAELPDNSS